MRRVSLVGLYLIVMVVLGFVVAGRVVSRRRTVHHAPPIEARAGTPTPSATPVPTPTPSALVPSPYDPNRLVIPELGINSAWLPLGYLADGLTMDSPPGPRDLGWYTFSGTPGETGNAVFAGHVDWYTGEPALFGGLATLKPGSVIQVSRADGMLATYDVVSSDWFNYLQTDATPIIAPTPTPTLTLITCGGVFDSVTHEYDMRLVVKAVAEQQFQ